MKMTNNILLIYGGNSVEHEISIITALQVIKQYKGKYKLIPCYLKNNNFYYSKKLLDINFYKKENKATKINFKANQNFIYILGKKIIFEAVMIVSHGALCEDGTLYSYFKTLNIDVIAESPYSAIIGQDKTLTKLLCGINYIPFFECDYKEYTYNIKEILIKAEEIKYPLIIKPSCIGSSVGIKVATNPNELILFLDEAFCFSERVIIERKLDNFIELNIAAFANKNNIYLSEIEKVSTNAPLSYNDKYSNHSKSMKGQKKELPAKINETLKEQLIDFTTKAYKNLRCKYIVRFDYLYDSINNILFLNEVNNIPGALSLYLFTNIDNSLILDQYIDCGLAEIEKEKKIICKYNENILKQTNFDIYKTNK